MTRELARNRKGKRVLFALLCVGMLLAASAGIWATGQAEPEQKWPEKPIVLLTDSAPGGGEDLSCRALAESVGKILGQPVVVENRTGAGGAVSLGALANAKPDGYTIGQTSFSALAITPQMTDVPYDTYNSFDFILGYGEFVYGFIVNAESPLKTFQDLIDYAKANPGQAKIGVFGQATAHTLACASVAKIAGIQWDTVPFKGATLSMTALLGGHVTASTQIADVAMPQIDGGRVRLLGSLDTQRWKWQPDVPTLKEMGYDVVVTTYLGLGAPKGVPKPIMDKIVAAFKQTMDNPEFLKTMESFHLKVQYHSPDEFAQIVDKGYKEYGDFIRSLGLHKDQQKK